MIYYNNTHARNAVEIKELDPLVRYVLKVSKSHTEKNTPKKYKENVKRGKTEKTKGDYAPINVKPAGGREAGHGVGI